MSDHPPDGVPSIEGILLQRVVSTVYARPVVDYFPCSCISDDLFEIHYALLEASDCETAFINQIDHFVFVPKDEVVPTSTYLKRLTFISTVDGANENEFITYQEINYFCFETDSNGEACCALKKVHPFAEITRVENYTFVSTAILIKPFVPNKYH